MDAFARADRRHVGAVDGDGDLRFERAVAALARRVVGAVEERLRLRLRNFLLVAAAVGGARWMRAAQTRRPTAVLDGGAAIGARARVERARSRRNARIIVAAAAAAHRHCRVCARGRERGGHRFGGRLRVVEMIVRAAIVARLARRVFRSARRRRFL